MGPNGLGPRGAVASSAPASNTVPTSLQCAFMKPFCVSSICGNGSKKVRFPNEAPAGSKQMPARHDRQAARRRPHVHCRSPARPLSLAPRQLRQLRNSTPMHIGEARTSGLLRRRHEGKSRLSGTFRVELVLKLRSRQWKGSPPHCPGPNQVTCLEPLWTIHMSKGSGISSQPQAEGVPSNGLRMPFVQCPCHCLRIVSITYVLKDVGTFAKFLRFSARERHWERSREKKGEGKRGEMPRRQPRTSALQVAQAFCQFLIAETETEDCILPKNGTVTRSCVNT